jgi:glycosyltransferase XagB
LSIQGQAIRALPEVLEATLPPEIAFLCRHGIESGILRQVVETAAAVGVTADVAALKCGLVDEVVFYRALADELGLPFLTKIQVADQARYPESILAGLAPLAPALGSARYAVAPTGGSVTRLLSSRPQVASGLVITTPSSLHRGVLEARPRTIAWHAANELPASKPEWSAKDGGSWTQIGWAAIISGALSVSTTLAPSATLSIMMALSSMIFLGMVVLRMAAARERIGTEPLRSVGRYEDCDLPVYTVIVALYRERRVLARLVEAITAIDYPALCSKCTKGCGGDRCASSRCFCSHVRLA